MKDNNKWFRDKPWHFNGREVCVRDPDEPHLSVVCIPMTEGIADLLVQLQEDRLAHQHRPDSDLEIDEECPYCLGHALTRDRQAVDGRVAFRCRGCGQVFY